MSSGFISEADIAEKRRIRQEDWQSKRGEEDPEEAPEEPVDHRSLFDRLQEQKQKKQDEWEEAHKFKNMVRGLEDEEVDFLDLVDRTKMNEEKRVRTEEKTIMEEYRKKVTELKKKALEEERKAEMKVAETKKTGPKKNSQLSLLAGAIKRKSSDDKPATGEEKKQKTSEEEEDQEKSSKSSVQKEDGTSHSKDKAQVTQYKVSNESSLKCIAILPGLGAYTDSSDSEGNEDSDSDDDDLQTPTHSHPRDITGRVIKVSNSQSSYC
ncbi:PSME3-interacting protein [Oratosquilla oratoria]|uniref:PSME3-interacting protein n=1 Tax=Oratosquilla oratoria TaxID=337810 RepID=UPI003F76AAD7